MAAIDTIEVGRNLAHTHADTADIYFVNAEGFAGEAVEQIMVPLDLTGIEAISIIANNAYGASGSTVCVKARLTGQRATNPVRSVNVVPGLTSEKFADVEILPWTSIAIGAAATISADIDVSLVKSAELHLFCAIVGTTAHLGTEFRVLARNEATVTDGWTTLNKIAMCSGKTALKLDIASTAVAGQKVIAVANPTAGNLNKINKNIFILDATVANSEICYQTAVGADS